MPGLCRPELWGERPCLWGGCLQGQEGSWGVSEQGWVSNGLLGAQAPPEIVIPSITGKGQGGLDGFGVILGFNK